MNTIHIWVVFTLFLGLASQVFTNRVRKSVNWNGNNWALGCDFRGNDLSHAEIPGEECGGRCAATPGCTHFSWTTHNGKTCWMKSGPVSPSDAFSTGDPSTVCGYIEGGSGGGGGSGSSDLVGKSYSGVLTTRHPAVEAGACQLPEASYVSGIHPVALGNIDSLGDLKHQPGLCGHIFQLNCGKGPVDIIVTNANLGGGLDLYASSWDLATGNKPPGQEWCTVQLTKRNAFNFQGARCYYSPESEKYNDYYHLLGIFNTDGRIVTKATLGGHAGSFNSITAYFAFNGGPVSQDAEVKFWFSDGSSHSVPLRDCVRENGLHIWS